MDESDFMSQKQLRHVQSEDYRVPPISSSAAPLNTPQPASHYPSLQHRSHERYQDGAASSSTRLDIFSRQAQLAQQQHHHHHQQQQPAQSYPHLQPLSHIQAQLDTQPHQQQHAYHPRQQTQPVPLPLPLPQQSQHQAQKAQSQQQTQQYRPASPPSPTQGEDPSSSLTAGNDEAQDDVQDDGTMLANPALTALKKKHRPRTSCDQCRHRKIKCDRVQPCLACCQAGRPRECNFPGQAGDNAVPQSQEIKALRKNNVDLRRRVTELEDALRDGRIVPISGSGDRPHDLGLRGDSYWDQEIEVQMNGGRKSSPPLGASASKGVKKIGVNGKIEKQHDSLFFGTPNAVNVLPELGHSPSKNSESPTSLAYLRPRGFDIEAYEDLPPYPFPALWLSQYRTTPLLQLLPPEDELLSLVMTFEKNRTFCLYPHMPREMARDQVQVFLSDVQANAERDPQRLALLFATLALGALLERFEKPRIRSDPNEMERERRKADVFVAAAMHSLRLSSFLNRPSLVAIQALLMMGAYLNSAANFTNAFSLFGTTIRLAHCLGLHRNPKLLKPVPSDDDCRLWRILWWYMLYMDVKFSITLGRPLGISGIGDCQPALPMMADHTVTRFLLFANQFTILGRQILASESTSDDKIDKFSDELLELFDTLPAVIRFEVSWLQEINASGWPLGPHAVTLFTEIHNYLVLLNRQRTENQSKSSDKRYSTSGAFGSRSNSHSSPGSTNSHSASEPPIRGYARVTNSSRCILEAFIFARRHIPMLLSAWTLCQKAFNAAMILALHMRDTFDTSDLDLVVGTQEIFVELKHDNAHQLAGLAADRLAMLTNPSWMQDRPQIQHRTSSADQYHHHQQQQQHQHQHQHHDGRQSKRMAMPTSRPTPQTHWSPPEWLEHESVMGGTGMMLLDDHGLRGPLVTRF